MTSAAITIPLYQTGRGATSRAGFWQTCHSWFRRLTMTNAQRRASHLLEYASDRFGAELLEVCDLQELDDYLDNLFVDRDFRETRRLMVADLGQALTEPSPPAELRDWLARDLAEWVGQDRALVDECADAIAGHIALIQHLAAVHPEPTGATLEHDELWVQVEALVYDMATPRELAEALLASTKADGCMFAAMRLRDGDVQAASWLRRALLERLRDHTHVASRLVATFAPGLPEWVTVEPFDRQVWNRLHADSLQKIETLEGRVVDAEAG